MLTEHKKKEQSKKSVALFLYLHLSDSQFESGEDSVDLEVEY